MKNNLKPLPATKDELTIEKQTLQEDEKVYSGVEVQPEFQGGMGEFYNYFLTNFKIPAQFNGKGKIIAQFTVEKNGELTNIKILKDAGSGTAQEAARVLRESPKWKPGLQNKIPVRVLYTLPISLDIKK